MKPKKEPPQVNPDIYKELFNYQITESPVYVAVKRFKPLSVFQHIDNLTINKVKWEDLRPMDKQSFSAYSVVYFLGLDNRLIVPLNDYINNAEILFSAKRKKEMYKVLYELLPKAKIKYKRKHSLSQKLYNKELIAFLKRYYEVVSEREVREYLDIFYSNETYKQDLKRIIMLYGKTEEEALNLLKLVKNK